MDVTGIHPGRDFRKAIDDAVGSCDLLIVMIGKKWLESTDDRGRRRLDDPEDFVRMETAVALRRGIPVIPVLVQGTVMPRSDQLPGELDALVWRSAFEVRHARWEIDVAELLKALKKVVKASRTSGTPEAANDKRSGPIRKWAVLAVGGALIGVVVYALLTGIWPPYATPGLGDANLTERVGVHRQLRRPLPLFRHPREAEPGRRVAPEAGRERAVELLRGAGAARRGGEERDGEAGARGCLRNDPAFRASSRSSLRLGGDRVRPHSGTSGCRGLGPGLPMRRGSVPVDGLEAPTRRYTLGTCAVYERVAVEILSPSADRDQVLLGTSSSAVRARPSRHPDLGPVGGS